MTPLILRLDVTGQPLRWIPWRVAVVLDTRSMIAWNAGDHLFTFHGGFNRISGEQSIVTISSIIAVKGKLKNPRGGRLVPPLSNAELFLRDGQMCMYCGRQHAEHMLTRDHVRPLSQGGKDTWSNVVTACKPCNHAKGARTPEQAGMSLLAVPFVPNRAEYLVLSNRRILADQMEFLKKRFRNGSRLSLTG
ncbi:MAG TPA: HNH endonuclease [Gammaproteobacteria bacterium]|nr:HNH endonuclease [Gammaproteobacteria bacterium]